MLAEGLLILLVVTLGSSIVQQGSRDAVVDVVRFKATAVQKQAPPAPEDKPEESRQVEPRPPKAAEPEKAVPQPPQPQPPQPQPPQQPPPQVIRLAPAEMAAANIARPRPAPPAVVKGQNFGPPDRVGAPRDSALVSGSGPNGERLYAASWYREPYKDELEGYLSTATGPGWGLIACRTAPDFRVEDCVPVDEYPTGSNINRAILAAAWQFRVRPPRIGGESKVGEWVRIRIDYGMRQR